MASFATAVKSKSPLSSLFWSDSRFQLRGDLGSIRISAVAWVKPCNTPGADLGELLGDNFGPQNAVPDLDLNERFILNIEFFFDSLKYVAEIFRSCLVIEQVWKIWNF